MRRRNLIVFSCDRVFFPLLKGAILSLEEHNAFKNLNLDIAFIDIGCKPEQTDWLKDRNIEVVSFDKFEEVIDLGNKLVKYNKSQICRPYLPDIFSNHTNIIWCDSDIWFQTLNGIKIYVELVNQYPDKIIVCPFIDTSYSLNYSSHDRDNILSFVQYSYRWYKYCYSDDIAEKLKGRVIFSSGLFAMNCENPIWELWKNDLNIVYNPLVIADVNLRHLAEQTAFNKIVYQTENFIPVESRYNFNCHVGITGSAIKDGKKVITTGFPPFNLIDVIHLTATGRFIKEYVKKGMLWNNGEYLTDEDKNVLLGICHY